MSMLRCNCSIGGGCYRQARLLSAAPPPTLTTPGVSPALLSGRYWDSSATSSLFLSI